MGAGGSARGSAPWNTGPLPLEGEDVRTARDLVERHPGLTARDLVPLACCRRVGVREPKTFDRALAAAVRG